MFSWLVGKRSLLHNEMVGGRLFILVTRSMLIHRLVRKTIDVDNAKQRGVGVLKWHPSKDPRITSQQGSLVDVFLGYQYHYCLNQNRQPLFLANLFFNGINHYSNHIINHHHKPLLLS